MWRSKPIGHIVCGHDGCILRVSAELSQAWDAKIVSQLSSSQACRATLKADPPFLGVTAFEIKKNKTQDLLHFMQKSFRYIKVRN